MKTFVKILVGIVLVLWPAAAGAEFYYFHEDHLGGSSVVTDADGDVAAVYDYYPYGETYYEEIFDGNFLNPYKFTDQEEDSETGLYYYDARYYDAGIGRFYSQDPAVYDERMLENLGNPQALNSYSYVLNNPVKYTDPSGEESAVIFYGDNYGREDSDAFQQKASARASELDSQYDDGAYSVSGLTFDDWQNALSTYEDISLIEYYGHGDNEAIYLRSSDLLLGVGSAVESIFSNSYSGSLDYYSDGARDHYVDELFIGNVVGDLEMHLWSCNSTVGGGSVAQSFADHFNASVYGANTSVNFKGHQPFVKWYRKWFSGGQFEWMSPNE